MLALTSVRIRCSALVDPTSGIIGKFDIGFVVFLVTLGFRLGREEVVLDGGLEATTPALVSVVGNT